MTDIGFKIGGHDTGFWDNENEVMANKKPFIEGVNVNEAIKKAKQQPGAELVIVDKAGNAKAHSLSIEDSMIQENKTIKINELSRDSNPQKKLDKTPLTVINFVAQEFSGDAAFLVDNNNNVTYLVFDREVPN